MKDHAPSAERNRSEILPHLGGLLPESGMIFEIASGTGQHAAHFAPSFPGASWQPSERRVDMFPSIRAWAAEAGASNVLDPIELDVTWTTWPVPPVDAIYASNMLHISPWEAALGLLAGAARTLKAGGLLVYYGALLREDRETAPGNLAFDASLRERDASWGVRHLEQLQAAAEETGLEFDRVLDLPRNNSLLVFRQPSRSSSS